MNPVCGQCKHFENCGGGAPCITYGYCGNPFATDPQCPEAFGELPDPGELLKQTPLDSDDDKEPLFWDNLIVSPMDGLGRHFEFVGSEMFYVNESEKERVVRELAVNENVYLEIDLSQDFDSLAADIVKNSPNRLFLSIKMDASVDHEKLYALLRFLEKLKSEDVDFEVTNYLPERLFGIQSRIIFKKYSMPTILMDSLDLFVVRDGFIELPLIKKKGPKIKYMKDRNQIFEYFSVLKNQMESAQNISVETKIGETVAVPILKR